MPDSNDRSADRSPVSGEDVEKTQVIPHISAAGGFFTPPAEESPETPSPREEELPDYLEGKYESIESESFELGIDASPDFRHSLANYGNRYQLQKLLATGGFGQLFLAFDRVLGRKVVVKSLRSELLENQPVIEQFIGEAKLNSQLDHPGILPLFSLDGDSQGGVHLAMQLVRGITLKDFLNRLRKNLTENTISHAEFKKKLQGRLEMFLRICEAIEYCHCRRIIHNDLKPDNIMIARYGQLYVMDWGSASFENSCQQTRMTGTPAYIAPERVRNRLATKQSDIFSLGMILNEMATLQPPISGKNSQEVLKKLVSGCYPPARCYHDSCKISSSLRAIIEKARNLDPAKRYQSVRQLATDVRNLLFHEEIVAKPDNFVQKQMRYLYHHQHLTYLLLIATAAIIAGALFFSVVREQQFINRVNSELLKNYETRARVDHLSLFLSRRLLQLREQLNGLSSALVLQMEQLPETSPAPCFRNEDFLPRSTYRPHGLIHARAYPNAISLKYGSWYFPGKAPAAPEKERIIHAVNRQQSQWHVTLMTDIFDEKEHMVNPLRQFLNQGGLIRTIIASFNNGMVCCYPGTYRKVPSRFGYNAEFILRKLRGTDGIWWSQPEQDASGEWLIACWIPMRDQSGYLLGTIGFEISYQKLLQPLRDVSRKDGAVYALVDDEDQVLYDSRHTYDSTCKTEQKSYSYPALLRTIRAKGTLPHFETVLNRQKYRIFWTRIPFSSWLLIEHFPEKERR